MLWFLLEQFASHRRSEFTGLCLKWHSACFPQMSGIKQFSDQITVPPPWVMDISLPGLPTPTIHWWCDPANVMSNNIDVMTGRCSVSRNTWHDWHSWNKHNSPLKIEPKIRLIGKPMKIERKQLEPIHLIKERKKVKERGLELGTVSYLFQTYLVPDIPVIPETWVLDKDGKVLKRERKQLETIYLIKERQRYAWAQRDFECPACSRHTRDTRYMASKMQNISTKYLKPLCVVFLNIVEACH